MELIANWLWQGTALAIAATIALHSSKRVSATVRYRLWWLTMLIVLLLPAAPSISLLVQSTLDLDQRSAVVPASAGLLSTSDVSSRVLMIPAVPRLLLLIAGITWAGWFIVSMLRMTLAVRHLRRARSGARVVPAARAERLLNWAALRSQGRTCTLAISDDVGAAAVLGPSAPLIAISPRLLADLTDEELDRIVVHEWAHVQRRDDVARVIQVAVRAVAGLHPAVWWIDRRLHLEREAACDDWAVTLTGSARGYAACLTKVAALQVRSRDPLLVPAAMTSSDLATRVMRLLDARRCRSMSRRSFATSLVAVSLVTLAIGVRSFELVVAATPAGLQEPEESAPAMVAGTSATRYGERGVDVAHVTSVPAGARQAQQSKDADRSVPPSASVVDPVTGAATHHQTAAPAASPSSVPAPDARAAHAPAPPVSHVAVTDAVTVPGVSVPVPVPPTQSETSRTPTPWGAAADAGVGVGRGSQKAAVATAGFFSKLGKSIARSF
ncbi:MAG TPA: M56 family metallopeptidase [Vicinamibacterales bacterium]|nr:M56 family metallopeptidase [Vicinamibacterales bacterium]